MNSLTPTAHTILGYVASHARSGYEIRQAAARNPFWGISDGQLYPQLKILAEAGLIVSEGQGGPRGKTVWQITPAGREALKEWLRQDSPPVAIRDENLAKLLFAAPLDRKIARALVQERMAHFASFLAQIEAAVPASTWSENERTSAGDVPELVREYGLEYSRTALTWCEQVLSALGDEQ